MLNLESIRAIYNNLDINKPIIEKPERKEVKKRVTKSIIPALKAQEKVFNVIAKNSEISRGEIAVELNQSIEHTGLCIKALIKRGKVSRKMIKLSGTARGYIHKIITE